MSAKDLKSLATGKPPADAPPAEKLSHMLMRADVQQQLKMALPAHMKPERMARIALTEIRKVPKLAECDQRSFIGAIVQCAQLGLEPGNALGHAYILPFEKRKYNNRTKQWETVGVEAQVIIGYRGMIDLARRSGQIVSLNATAVYEGDHFEARFGLDPNVDHVPDFDNPDRENADKLKFVYAVAKLKDGGTQFVVMSRRQLEAIRDRSQGYGAAVEKQKKYPNSKLDNPWMTDFEPMALKTAIRRLFKYLPVSVEMLRATILDETAEAGKSQGNEHALDPGFDPFTLADDGEVLLTYAELAAQMNKAETRDQGEMVLGSAEHLPQEQWTDLQKLLDAKFKPDGAAA